MTKIKCYVSAIDIYTYCRCHIRASEMYLLHRYIELGL